MNVNIVVEKILPSSYTVLIWVIYVHLDMDSLYLEPKNLFHRDSLEVFSWLFYDLKPVKIVDIKLTRILNLNPYCNDLMKYYL